MSIAGAANYTEEKRGGVVGSGTSSVALAKETGEGFLTDVFSQLVQEKREELEERIKSGVSEPTYQIGAASYTEKEWKRMLEKFDRIQEMIREEIKAEAKKKEKEAEKGKEKQEALLAEERKAEIDAESIEEARKQLLFAETIVCNYDSPEQDGQRKCIIFYQKDGIYCRIEGQSGFEWVIKLKDESQYEKVMEYLKNLDVEEDAGVISQMDFWQRFLK